MLISRVPEDGGEGRGEPAATEQVAEHCRTASELFELMTKDHDFESGDDTLMTRDLVLLYKNIDLGKQLMSNANEFKSKAPNQYVENVIYHDDAETDSDLSETLSSEDLHSIMMVNKERIDLLTKPSLNSLCHKLGDLEIQVSNISTDYQRSFLFKDPHIKEQLKLLTKSNGLDTPALPASLLDYVCCKRLEDNYNFYMDNIIRHVKHTIEQLKRISNGDYLPDRVKEKWREVEHENGSDNLSKVLATSVSIPLQVERKVTGLATAWDDIVHSEVDLRSLVKILEKKIVLEVPKVISGSYNLFRKYRADSLIISCKRKKKAVEQTESRLDVVLQLHRSDAGHVLSNIDSIMVLQPRQQNTKDCTEFLPLTYGVDQQPVKITSNVIELPEPYQNCEHTKNNVEFNECRSLSLVSNRLTDYRDDGDCKSKDSAPDSGSAGRAGAAAVAHALLRRVARVVRAEAATDHASPNDLQFSILNLNRQTSLPEEGSSEPIYTTERKKSPVKVRIKSPYENKSSVIEERKRRRLLAVRERRERKKIAMCENSKITKHKPSPQAVNSVTKLSITNKAFYNSIYGRNVDCEYDNRIYTGALKKHKGPKGAQTKDGAIQEIVQETEGEAVGNAPDTACDFNSCNFLDDAETEIGYLQKKLDNDCFRFSTSTSFVSNESTPNLLTQPDCCPSVTSLRVKEHKSATGLEKPRSDNNIQKSKTQCTVNEVPSNSPKSTSDNDKLATAVACRRSIEKIYTLMQKLHQIETNESTEKKKTAVSIETQGSLLSESGTSLNHRSSFTNPSYATFEKPANLDELEEINKDGDETYLPSSVIPKVVISTKAQADVKDVTKKERKKSLRVRTIPENPLKAISQLLHEFDNVQKSRQKIADPKTVNRSMATELRNVSRPEPQKRRSRIGSPVKEEPLIRSGARVKTRFAIRDDLRPEATKTHLPDRRRISDLIDEVKEARGEAVRGPPKLSSRLDALAQPKRAYVQALSEEFPKRQVPERMRAASSRRRGHDAHSSLASVRHPHSVERASARSPGRGAERSGERRGERRGPADHAAPAHHTLRPTLKKRSVAEEPSSGERVAPARAPLLPSDLELIPRPPTPVTADIARSSSSTIGDELHRMVATVLLAERPGWSVRRPGRPAQRPERRAAPEEGATDTTADTPSVPFASFDHDENLTDAEISTVIEEISPERSSEASGDQTVTHDVTSMSSSLEIQTLEHALHRKLSSGTFPGRLRLQKLTLAPKPSLQCVMMHQSGDSSVVLKTSLSQKIRVAKSTTKKTDLMALLSTTRLNRGLYGFPLQISTVGYVFPVLQGGTNKATPKMSKDLSLGTLHAGGGLFPATTVLDIIDGRDRKTCRCVMTETTLCEIECAVQTNCPDRLFSTACLLNTLTATATKNVETSTSEGLIAVSSHDTTVKRNADNKSCTSEEIHELSEYTTSLDILVGLLNEIQKITTCTDEVTSAQTLGSESNEPSPLEKPAVVVPNKGARDAKDEVLTDNCFSLFVSDTEINSDHQVEILIPETKSVSAEAMECRPLCKDKEVLAQVPEMRKRDAEVNTDPPPSPRDLSKSKQVDVAPDSTKTTPTDTTMPMTIIDTCVTNVSTTGYSVSPLTRSELGESDSNTSSQSGEKMIEQPEINRNSVKSLVPFYNNMFKVENIKKDQATPWDHFAQNIQRNSSAPSNVIANIVRVRKSKDFDESNEIQNQNITKKVDKCLNHVDIDARLKMKRDILVSFYSILVLTVFAALAFPEILQHA